MRQGTKLCSSLPYRPRSVARTKALGESVQLASQFPGDFTLQYPPRREYFKEFFRTAEQPRYASQAIDDPRTTADTDYARQLLLYFHIPFCEHKCSYCNFAVDTRSQKEIHEGYINHLIEGTSRLQKVLLEPMNDTTLEIPGIDIGGGTPTLLETPTLQRFLEALRPLRDACSHPRPLSIETTPAIASKEIDRLHALKEGGVDRVSMGMQSTDDELLAQMNRKKETTLSARAVENIKRVGFQRFSVDVIFGLPGQTLEHWKNDLQRIIDLDIDTVTTYDCLYRGKGRAMTRSSSRPSPEVYGALYDYGYEFLTSHGFHAPYGSVNFTKHENETGTSPYFEGRLLDGLQFLGMGNYASSTMGDKWWFAPFTVDQWIQNIHSAPETSASTEWAHAGQFLPLGDCYTLPVEERAAKYLLQSLTFGVVDPRRYERIFGEPLRQRFSETLRIAQEHGWLRKDEHGVYLIEYGQFKNMPKLRSLFYSSPAISWLQTIRDSPEEQYRHRIIRKIMNKQ